MIHWVDDLYCSTQKFKYLGTYLSQTLTTEDIDTDAWILVATKNFKTRFLYRWDQPDMYPTFSQMTTGIQYGIQRAREWQQGYRMGYKELRNDNRDTEWDTERYKMTTGIQNDNRDTSWQKINFKLVLNPQHHPFLSVKPNISRNARNCVVSRKLYCSAWHVSHILSKWQQGYRNGYTEL